MASIINASTSGAGGLISTADNSGTLQLQTAGTTAMTINSSQVVNFANSPTIAGSAFPSGAMSLISTFTGNNTTNLITFTGLSGYKTYLLIFNNLLEAGSSAAGSQPNVNLGTGSTPTYSTSNYSYQFIQLAGSSTVNGSYNYGSFSCGFLTGANGVQQGATSPALGASGYLYFQGFNSNTPVFIGQYNTQISGGFAFGGQSFTVILGAVPTAIKITFSNNVYSGTASLYGISS